MGVVRIPKEKNILSDNPVDQAMASIRAMPMPTSPVQPDSEYARRVCGWVRVCLTQRQAERVQPVLRSMIKQGGVLSAVPEAHVMYAEALLRLRRAQEAIGHIRQHSQEGGLLVGNRRAATILGNSHACAFGQTLTRRVAEESALKRTGHPVSVRVSGGRPVDAAARRVTRLTPR